MNSATPTSPAVDADVLSAAVEIVREAGELTLSFFRASDLVVDE